MAPEFEEWEFSDNANSLIEECGCEIGDDGQLYGIFIPTQTAMFYNDLNQTCYTDSGEVLSRSEFVKQVLQLNKGTRYEEVMDSKRKIKDSEGKP